jgi:DNA-binding transcriptional regulator YdaS (Cro superfamily)
MQTLYEYMNGLTMKDHAAFVKRCGISKTALYAVRGGSLKLSLDTALDIHEKTDGKVDPRTLTKEGIWRQLDEFYAKQKRRRARKA